MSDKIKENVLDKEIPFSNDYKEWVKQSELILLTNTQHKFAEWLLSDNNRDMMSQVGSLSKVFISVRKYLRNKP